MSHVTRHFLWEGDGVPRNNGCILQVMKRSQLGCVCMYAQFSTRNGHRVKVNQAWTEQKPIFHLQEKVTKATHSRVPGNSKGSGFRRNRGEQGWKKKLESFGMVVVVN